MFTNYTSICNPCKVSSRGFCQKVVRKDFTCELLVWFFFAPFMISVEEEIEKARKVVPEARRDLSCSYSKARWETTDSIKMRDRLGRYATCYDFSRVAGKKKTHERERLFYVRTSPDLFLFHMQLLRPINKKSTSTKST